MYELTRMIFSKSKWRRPKILGCEVLYVSQTATNVRTALEEAVTARAYLEGVDLVHADLGRAQLPGALLPGARMGGANLREANLQGALLSGARFGQVVGADFSGALLSAARFGEVVESDFSGAQLRGACLNGLRKCDLSGADLSDAYIGRRLDNMLGNNFDGADVRGLSVDYDVMINIDFTRCRNLGELVVRQRELLEPADGNYGYHAIELELRNWKAIHRAGGPGSIQARSK